MDALIRLALLAGIALALPAAQAAEKLVVGYVEEVRIFPGGLALHARVDTGAEHSSLNAVDVERFVRGGRDWVRFSVTNRANRSTVVERPVHRSARIRRHGGRTEERDVLMLGVCLGTVYKEVEVNIVDRTGLSYQMLVGRSFLAGDFLVDPAARNVLEPRCQAPGSG